MRQDQIRLETSDRRRQSAVLEICRAERIALLTHGAHLDATAHLAKLDNRSRPDWGVVADVLNALEKDAVADAEGRAWASVVAQRVGCTVNQVRQAQRTLRTLTTLTEAHPPARANLAKLRYSNLEVLARMAVIAPDRALEILDTDRRFTNRELLDAYQALKSHRPEALSPLAQGQRASRALVAQAERMAREFPQTFGLDLESRLASWPGIFAWAHPRFVSYTPSIGKLHAFSVFHTSEPDVTDALARFFLRAATESTFFDVYHVFVRSPLRTGLDWRELGLENLGFYGLSESSDEIQVYQKPAGDPAPDRRKALLLDPAVNAFLTANL